SWSPDEGPRDRAPAERPRRGMARRPRRRRRGRTDRDVGAAGHAARAAVAALQRATRSRRPARRRADASRLPAAVGRRTPRRRTAPRRTGAAGARGLRAERRRDLPASRLHITPSRRGAVMEPEREMPVVIRIGEHEVTAGTLTVDPAEPVAPQIAEFLHTVADTVADITDDEQEGDE